MLSFNCGNKTKTNNKIIQANVLTLYYSTFLKCILRAVSRKQEPPCSVLYTNKAKASQKNATVWTAMTSDPWEDLPGHMTALPFFRQKTEALNSRTNRWRSQYKCSFLWLFCGCISFCISTEHWTQGLGSEPHSHVFLKVFILRRGLTNVLRCPGWAWTWDPHISTSQNTEIKVGAITAWRRVKKSWKCSTSKRHIKTWNLTFLWKGKGNFIIPFIYRHCRDGK